MSSNSIKTMDGPRTRPATADERRLALACIARFARDENEAAEFARDLGIGEGA